MGRWLDRVPVPTAEHLWLLRGIALQLVFDANLEDVVGNLGNSVWKFDFDDASVASLHDPL